MSEAEGSRVSLAARLAGAFLVVVGAVLVVLNALYLPAVVRVHGGEWVPVAFHLGVVAVGLVLVGLGWRLVRRGRSRSAE